MTGVPHVRTLASADLVIDIEDIEVSLGAQIQHALRSGQGDSYQIVGGVIGRNHKPCRPVSLAERSPRDECRRSACETRPTPGRIGRAVGEIRPRSSLSGCEPSIRHSSVPKQCVDGVVRRAERRVTALGSRREVQAPMAASICHAVSAVSARPSAVAIDRPPNSSCWMRMMRSAATGSDVNLASNSRIRGSSGRKQSPSNCHAGNQVWFPTALPITLLRLRRRWTACGERSFRSDCTFGVGMAPSRKPCTRAVRR